MSGHSKWSTIKRKKGAADAKRGKLFAKLIKGIESAARTGGADVDSNPTLATAIQKAKDNSVPKDNIERALARGAGDVDGIDYIEAFYEGYAPGGVALYVQILTDNRNRAASDVRSAFSKNGGNLGEPGSVGYLFEQKGYILATGEEDAVMMAAIATPAAINPTIHNVRCLPKDLPDEETLLGPPSNPSDGACASLDMASNFSFVAGSTGVSSEACVPSR